MLYENKYIKYKEKYISLKNNLYGIWNNLPNELYIIGDIHGDFFALKQSLELTNCVQFEPYNEKLVNNTLNDGCKYYSLEKRNVKWIKKNSFIVFAGDIVDRCRPDTIHNPNCSKTINDENCDYNLLEFLFKLDDEAQKYNSRVIILLGNHEILNLQNDVRYVSLKGLEDKNRLSNIKKLYHQNKNKIFALVRINKYIIVHGGINDKYFIEFNKLISDKRYESIALYNQYIRNVILEFTEPIDDNRLMRYSNSVFTKDSPFWDRTLGSLTDNQILNNEQCNNIFNNNILNINNMNELKIIVAHCPQFVLNTGINLVDCGIYKDRIWKIDIGMSRAFDTYNFNNIRNALSNIKSSDDFTLLLTNNNFDVRKISVLQIKNKEEKILKGILSFEYFYKNWNTTEENKLKYILSDIKKMLKPTDNNYILIENILHKN